mmetsp:Transcript_1403/g.1952  ORF Transcript_1403/g.1952 Transcript_1403/m.1952 type:complete len:241 (-) Transcript_1403:548-1270(-)
MVTMACLKLMPHPTHKLNLHSMKVVGSMTRLMDRENWFGVTVLCMKVNFQTVFHMVMAKKHYLLVVNMKENFNMACFMAMVNWFVQMVHRIMVNGKLICRTVKVCSLKKQKNGSMMEILSLVTVLVKANLLRTWIISLMKKLYMKVHFPTMCTMAKVFSTQKLIHGFIEVHLPMVFVMAMVVCIRSPIRILANLSAISFMVMAHLLNIPNQKLKSIQKHSMLLLLHLPQTLSMFSLPCYL